MPENYYKKVEEAAAFLRQKISISPKLIVVLSGGLQGFADILTDILLLKSTEVPHFPKARAEGHAGELVFGKYYGYPLVVLRGRYHFYEGLSAQEVVFPYFVLKQLGAEIVMSTNAVGGVRNDLNPGDIMLVTDHINMMGTNPLIGIALHRPAEQFTNMNDCYDPNLIKLAYAVGAKQKLKLKEGVYLANSGPSYETKSEIKMFRGWGADTVGMSSVFEVIASRFLKMRVLMLNIVANPAADRHEGELSHQEVLVAMEKIRFPLVLFLQKMVEGIAKQ